MAELNAVEAAIDVFRAIVTTRKPNPHGDSVFDHSGLAPVLDSVAAKGVAGAVSTRALLDPYMRDISEVDPETMSPRHALEFWLNVYNAGALQQAVETSDSGVESVLRMPGAFSKRRVEVAGEHLSLDAIEHGKVRRFGDPRIHAALVCGSLSCPTLRSHPYQGETLDSDLDDQMRSFMRKGGAVPGGGESVRLSRIFYWYGGDFVRPQRMPTFIPASRRRLLDALRRWLPDELADASDVEFQSYDWSLACTVG